MAPVRPCDRRRCRRRRRPLPTPGVSSNPLGVDREPGRFRPGQEVAKRVGRTVYMADVIRQGPGLRDGGDGGDGGNGGDGGEEGDGGENGDSGDGGDGGDGGGMKGMVGMEGG